MYKTVFINGRFLTQDFTGVQRVAFEYLYNLEKYFKDIEWVILSPKIKFYKSKKLNVSFKIVEIGKKAGYLWEQIELPIYLKNKDNTLINFCNMAPLFYKNNVVLLHDVAFLDNPEWFNKKFVAVYKFLMPKILKKSKKIITVSEFSKKRIIHHYSSIDQNKVKVIYNGVTYFNGNPQENKEGRYALVVGSINKRKNHELIIKTFKELGKEFKLILVGNISKSFNHKIDMLPENVKIKSGIDNTELYNLYYHANLVICASLYEGFGLPILEALQFNKKVIASEIDVFKELFKGSVVFFNPKIKEDLKDKVKENWNASTSPKPFDLDFFSWKNSSQKLVDLINCIY
ncbi:glycosyltransferase family 4 protein [Neotamlana laminarinivorans]|uniref:Glycosyltransferase family 4 protein n=1 Tax=Neotamlana laminarinivorans TaxID=2883124 RepID=A0A9X1L3K5_9FLAO|nr:glycosyltransferase family 1 protein [Tamlana laminarinivorans]MCB4798327.1 glycosyltransferase family 4 protein [Tamlana laminarinivorans]